MEHQAQLQDLFTEGFRAFPHADAQRIQESQPYKLGFTAALEIDRLEATKLAIIEKAKELSGGNVLRVGFAR